MKAILKAWDKYPDNDHGKFSVLAFWSQEENEIITAADRIKEIFLNDGNVFEPSFYKNFSYYASNKYLLADTTVNSHEKATDKYKLSSVIREMEYTVVEYEGFLVGDDLVDLSVLENISHPLKNFYIKFYNKYWGPFKRDNNGNVVAITSGKVDVYSELSIVFDNEIPLVFEKPSKVDRTIPAYSISGINKWLNIVLKGITHPVSQAVINNKKWYQELKDVISADDQLTSSQLQLALRHIKSLEITYHELKVLLEHSDNLSLLSSKIDALKHEIKAELADDIKARIIEESAELKVIALKKNKLEKELRNIESNIKVEKSQLESTLQDLKKSIAENKSDLAKIKEEETYIREDTR